MHPMNPAALPPPALDGEHAGARLPKLRQMRMARVAHRMMTWAAVALIAGTSLTLVTPAVFAARPEDAPIPLAGMLVAAVQAVIPTLAGWAITLAVVLVLAAALALAPAWVQWRQARVPVALARRLRAGDRAGGIPLELLRIRIRWIPWQPWLPRRIRIRYPSGWVAADPSEELQELFLTDFRLPVRVDWQPAVDQIVVCRTRPAPEPTAEVEAPRVEDQSPMVGGVHTSIGSLLGGLTVDQEHTQLDEDGVVRKLVLTYDQTTKDVSPRFRARVQSVIEAKVPSPTGAWTMRWQPDQHIVHVVPSEPLPEYAAYTGLPAGHNDSLAVPLGLGSGGRIVCWRPLKFPHLLLAGATGGGKTTCIRTVLVMALLLGWRVWILDPKQTSFQYFKTWVGVERVCITGEQIRQALLDHRDEMQEVYDGLLAGTITHDDITPLLLIFDEVTEGFADVAEWVEENFEDIKEDRPGAKLTREMKRGEFACWRVTRKGREARRWQLLGLQRPDTTFIPGEARDNLITRVAAGHLRADGLKMVFEDPSVRQRVTRPKIDPATGEDRGEPIPGRSTADVGDGPEPLQWYYTPDPAPGRHTPEEMALLEHLREQVERTQAARQQREQLVRSTLRAAPAGREERRLESVAAVDLEEGQWVLLDTDGGGERPVQIEGIAEAGDDLVTVQYRVAAGGGGDYEIDCSDKLVLVSGPADR